MIARAALRLEKKQQLRQRAMKFFSLDFVAERISPLLSELPQVVALPGWSAEIVRAKGTGRLTLRYDFDHGVTVYAKAYTDGLGASSFTVHRHLWQNGFGQQSRHAVPHPLGFIPEENLLLMSRAEGRPLDRLLAENPSEEVLPAARAAASWLVKLHAAKLSSVPAEPPCERIKIFKLADILAKAAAAYPEQAPLLLDLLQKIRKLAPRVTSPSPLTPTHGQYTPGSIFLHGCRVIVIDIDRVCHSDPAKDVAMFVHRVRSLLFRISGNAAGAEPIINAFIDEYRREAGGNLLNLPYYRALYSLKGFAKFAKDCAPGDPARPPMEEFYLSEFERCMGESRAWS